MSWPLGRAPDPSAPKPVPRPSARSLKPPVSPSSNEHSHHCPGRPHQTAPSAIGQQPSTCPAQAQTRVALPEGDTGKTTGCLSPTATLDRRHGRLIYPETETLRRGNNRAQKPSTTAPLQTPVASDPTGPEFKSWHHSDTLDSLLPLLCIKKNH